MKTIKGTLLVSVLLTSSIILVGQEDGKRKLEQDFENYKKFREQDFQEFKRKREEELKKMEQEYQDYYNEMMGLKKYYTEKKDTAKVNVINDIITFEKNVSNALGKPLNVTENIKIENPQISLLEQKAKQEDKEQTQNKNKKPSFQQAYQQSLDKQKENEVTENKEPTEKKGDKAKQENTQQSAAKQSTEDLSLSNLPTTERRGLPVLTPVPKIKSKITSPFGVRNHPTLGRPMKHNGVDFGTGRGAEIYAAADGKVVLAEQNRTFGNYVVLEHKDGHSSAYAHLDRMIISKGSFVSKGQLLGYSGSTGRSSGPHLHYEVRVNGTPVNPKDFLVETK